MNTTFTTFFTPISLKRAYIIKAFLAIMVITILSGTAVTNLKAQPTKQWDNTLGGDSYEYLYSGQQTTDGGYILGGTSHSNVISGDKSQNGNDPYSNDYWFVKLNAAGVKEWDKTIGGNTYESLQSMQQTADGGYILGGFSYSNASGDKSENSKGDDDYWIVKLNAAGIKEWDKTIGGSMEDRLYSIQQTADGGYILGGNSNSNAGGDKSENSRGYYDYWIVKLNAKGNKEWDKTLGGSNGEEFKSVRQTTDGGYIVGGISTSLASGDKSNNPIGSEVRDFWLIKLNSVGGIEWNKTIGGNGIEEFGTLEPTPDGGSLLGGGSYSNISGDKSENSKGGADYWIVKLNRLGIKEWDKTIGGSGGEGIKFIQIMADGGYILGGVSGSNISGDKSENSKGGFDYWLVKVNKFGLKEWDKTIGGNNEDQLSFIDQTTDGGYFLGGTSNSSISGDKSENTIGNTNSSFTDYWVVKLSAAPAPCTATGTILREQWDNINGTSIATIPLNNSPNSTSQLTAFEAPTNVGSNYGQRIRGYLCAPLTGSYTFYIAGDDNTELWLSTDDQPANKKKLASVTGWTNPREWTKYPSQKSAPIMLEAGRRYYIEALHKEGSGGDNLAVAWQLPDGLMEAPIAGARLFPFVPVVSTPPCVASGTILREQWNNVAGTSVSVIPVNTPPSSTSQLTMLEAPSNVGTSYGARIRGYICAPQSGNYTFWVAGDDDCELWLSTDANPANKVKIAGFVGYTAVRQWDKFASQKSALINLEANKRYYVEVLHKEGSGGDNLAVAWQLPNGMLEAPIAGARLSPFVPVVPPPPCTATGTILREQWNNISGTSITSIPLNSTPTSTGQLTSFEAPTNVGSNYGQRIRGYLCAPQTGSYTFYIAGDDDTELWLSTDEQPANKKKLASVTGWTNPREWTKYVSQKSAPIMLEAGRRYYIEALHKEGSGGDNLAVAWQLPDGLMEAPIAGTRLSPYTITSTPQLVSTAKPTSEATLLKAKSAFLTAYPNPFSKVATIQFSLAAPDMATLQVLNLNGRLLQTLHRGVVEKDRLYSFELTGDSFASGVYLCRLVYGKTILYERLVVIK